MDDTYEEKFVVEKKKKTKNMDDTHDEKPVVEKKKRTKNARRIKDIEKAILQQSLVIKEAKDFYRELVQEYDELTGNVE